MLILVAILALFLKQLQILI